MTVAGLLLAAGAGRRMGGPKALLRHPDGVTWVARAVRVLREGGCDPVLVVVGAQADAVEADVMADGVDGVSVVRAAGWAEGMGASLRSGLDALASDTSSDTSSDGALDNAKHLPRFAETHLHFCRVDVDIYGVGREV